MSYTKSRIWIIGAGGIGSAIASLYNNEHNQVYLISRRETNQNPIYKTMALDYLNDDLVSDLLNKESLPDKVVITSGLLYKNDNFPEKSITSMDKDWFLESIMANVLPSMVFLKHLTKKINKNKIVKVACFSARVGSITDNKLGGWHSYRMSKAALNMLIKNISIEWQYKSPNSTIISYHPGTVDTNLSRPFQRNVSQDKLFSSNQAAKYFMDVFEQIDCNQSGKLIDWQGKILEF